MSTHRDTHDLLLTLTTDHPTASEDHRPGGGGSPRASRPGTYRLYTRDTNHGPWEHCGTVKSEDQTIAHTMSNLNAGWHQNTYTTHEIDLSNPEDHADD